MRRPPRYRITLEVAAGVEASGEFTVEGDLVTFITLIRAMRHALKECGLGRSRGCYSEDLRKTDTPKVCPVTAATVHGVGGAPVQTYQAATTNRVVVNYRVPLLASGACS
jgi:hypothetical protein